MNYLKYIVATLYVHFGLVTLLRTLQTTGSGQWHHNMYDGISTPLLDWWWVIIPSMVIVSIIGWYCDAKTQKIFFWIFTGLVLFLIAGTYL